MDNRQMYPSNFGIHSIAYIIARGLIKSNAIIDCLLEQFCLYNYKSRLVVHPPPSSIQNSSHPVRCHSIHYTFDLLYNYYTKMI